MNITRKFMLVLMCAMLLAVFIKPVEAVTFNGREYTQVSGQWYEVYQDVNFKVIGTEIMVEFYGTATQTQIDNLLSTLSCDSIRVMYDGTYLVEYNTTPEVDPLDLCEDFLDETTLVETAVNNTEGKAAQPADEYYGWQFYLNDGDPNFDNDINFETAWNIQNGDPAIKIGVIDDGLLWTHPDIDGLNIWQNLGEDVGGVVGTLTADRDDYDAGDLNDVDDDANGFIDDLIGWSFTGGGSHDIGDAVQNVEECVHGTRISAIIGAMTDNNGGDDDEFAGIAGGDGEEDPGCSIVFCKVGGNYPTDRIIGSLNYLINVEPVDIINMSFIMAWNAQVEVLLAMAEANGILVCCASGNEQDDEVAFPANNETTVAVGASYDDDRWNASNYGDELQITTSTGRDGDDYLVYICHTDEANGWEIGLDPDNDGVEECFFAGTSAAAACVSAVAGLLLSENDELEPADLKEILFLTATRDIESAIENDGDPGTWDEEMGYGDLDAGEAVSNCDRLEVDLADGWSLVSTNLAPSFTLNNGLAGEGEGILCSFWELEEDLEILKDELGNFWTPEWEFNGIDEFDYQQGYYVKMDGGGNSWVSLGNQVPFNQGIEISDGWNLIAYYPENVIGARDAFADIVDDLVIVKDQDGNYYNPEFDFSNLNCNPGKGYQIHVSDDCTLNYPENGDLDQIDGFHSGRKSYANNEHFQSVRKTDHFHPILLTSISIERLECEPGDEIAVYSPDGLCIGASVYNDDLPMGLPVWRDDTLTVAIDGYLEMETFYLRYWDEDRNVEIGYDSLNIFSNLDSYEEEPSLSAHDLVIGHPEHVPGSFELDGNFPNPFNSETVINYSVTKTGYVSIVVFDVQGRRIRELASGQKPEGKHHVVWDGCDSRGHAVSSGTYLYKITYESGKNITKSTERKMMLIR